MPTVGFTPQEVFDEARQRNIALTTDVLTDAQLYAKFDEFLRAEILEVLKANPTVLVRPAAAAVTVTTGDGGTIDLDVAYLHIESIDATRLLEVMDVLLVDHTLRHDAARELWDDGRPIGALVMDGVNNRWGLKQLAHWAGVTSILPYVVPVPTPVEAGTLETDILFPRALLTPVAERLALLLGHKADLNADWLRGQEQVHAAARAAAVTQLTVR